MRCVLGAVDGQLCGDFGFGAVAWTRRLVGWVGEFRFCLKTGLDDLVGRLAVEDPLSSCVIAVQQALESVMGVDAHD
jgi:hypothetical protein